nr:hypothetical protein [uncultured Selenomonas sp.]
MRRCIRSAMTDKSDTFGAGNAAPPFEPAAGRSIGAGGQMKR